MAGKLGFKVPKDFDLKKVKDEADKHNGIDQVRYIEFVLKELDQQFLENPVELVDDVIKGLKIQYMDSLTDAKKAKEIHDSIKIISTFKENTRVIYEKKKAQLEVELQWRREQCKEPEKILWEKNKEDLPIFFDYLIHTLGLFSKETSDEQLTKHFMWRNRKTGKPEEITLKMIQEVRDKLSGITFENGEYKFVEHFAAELKDKVLF